MGVRTLVGTYDGTTEAAAMVDSVSGFVFGPLFEGDDAAEQIEAFLDWMGRESYLPVVNEIGIGDDLPRSPGWMDPRGWPDNGLEKLVVYWRREVWARAAAEG